MAAKIRTLLVVALALAVPLVLGTGNTLAKIVHLNDGAVQQMDGTFDLPTQGTCAVATTGYAPVPTIRPECLAVRFPAFATQGACEAVGTSPNNLAWTTSVCNDPANDGNQAGCEAIPGRLYSNGRCSVTMKDHSRNVAECVGLGGTWVTSGTCTGRWNAPVDTGLTLTTSPGDQCLRCHNERTQYNGTEIRWIGEHYLKMGHKNMSRKVTVGLPWAGPAGTEYPADDSGNVFDWITGRITIGGVPRDLAWIYGDWLSPLPRAIAKLPAATGSVCTLPAYTDQTSCLANAGAQWLGGVCESPAYTTSSTCAAIGGTWATGPSGVCDDPTKTASTCPSGHWIQNAGASYSCSRCHTTGATSDATIASGAGPGGKEPERSFPGITWDRNSDANSNLVNLSWGVKDDTNQYASWDQFGILCSRCHFSAVDDTTNGGVPPFTNPIGWGRHHAENTGVASDGGYCSDGRYTREAVCESAGKTWFSDCGTDPVAEICTNAAADPNACASGGNTWVPVAGWCSGNSSYGTDQTACTANGFTWTSGYCTVAGKTDPDLNLSSKCSGGSGINALTWRRNGSIQACLVAGAAWNGGFPTCDPASMCSKPGVYADKAACNAAGGTWSSLASEYTCLSAGGEYTGTKTRRGQIITTLCMECHRQETSGLPYDANNPATALKVGPAHNTVAFVSHPQGNQFLNSTHGRFTGTFDQIPSATLGAGYGSDFQLHGEAGNTGNGCTGCHNPHKSTVKEANPEGFFLEECTECHSNPEEAAEVPQVDLTTILHAGGPGTPLENMDTDPVEACFTCHMPEGIHLWRINTSPLYSTFPAGALTATVNANTSPHEGYTNAVWVDVDHACGQCHGGGTAQASTTGSVAAGSKVLTVASNTGFAAGSKVRIAGAGALEEDGITRGDLDTYIVSVAGGTTVNLAGASLGTVAGADVVQNATRNDASYKTKAVLASKAAGIHSGTPSVPPYINFSYQLGSPNTLMVDVDASASTCSGSSANCDAYTWDFGDGSSASGMTASHTYASAGAQTITLTVEEWGVSGGSTSKPVNVYAVDDPPDMSLGTCVWDPNTWTMTVNDASTDTDGTGVSKVTVNWGDGGVIASDSNAPFGPFTRTYLNVGSYTITHKAQDTAGQWSTRTCMASPAYFTISGMVQTSEGVAVPSATVTVKKGTTLVRTVYTASNGTFSVGSLKPATYTLFVTKPGYTFDSPAATLTVGPDSTGNIITPAAPMKPNIDPTASGRGGRKNRTPTAQTIGP